MLPNHARPRSRSYRWHLLGRGNHVRNRVFCVVLVPLSHSPPDYTETPTNIGLGARACGAKTFPLERGHHLKPSPCPLRATSKHRHVVARLDSEGSAAAAAAPPKKKVRTYYCSKNHRADSYRHLSVPFQLIGSSNWRPLALQSIYLMVGIFRCAAVMATRFNVRLIAVLSRPPVQRINLYTPPGNRWFTSRTKSTSRYRIV